MFGFSGETAAVGTRIRFFVTESVCFSKSRSEIFSASTSPTRNPTNRVVRIATRCVSRMTSSMKTCISDGLRTRISGVMTVGLAVSIVGLQGSRYFRMAYAKKSLSNMC